VGAEIKTCLVEVEAMDLEAQPEEKETVAEQQEVPKEEAAGKTVRTVKKHHGDWHLAVGCRQKLKKWTQDNGGSWKKFTTACRGMTCCAIPAQHKGLCCQGQGYAKNPERTNIQEETLGETGRHQWYKDPRLKEATTSKEGQDVRQDLQENPRAGDHKENIQIFRQDLKNE
jgi:hypothetical protein